MALYMQSELSFGGREYVLFGGREYVLFGVQLGEGGGASQIFAFPASQVCAVELPINAECTHYATNFA